ncbi:MAG: Ku protein, partial [Acidimicrobiales bacterium]|nr:Ku protein [Acidimicrobiales bacterium]
SEADGSEVPYDRIVKGYELASGTYVTLTNEELEGLDPKASRAIDLVRFVDQSTIDPIYYDSAYLLGPDPAAPKPYMLLRQAMADAGKVAVGTFVMRGKERLCALRPGDDGRSLLLNTMRYADEIRSISEIDEFEALEDVSVTDAELAMAEQLIASLDGDFDPEEYHDEYREKVLELIGRKSEGEDVVTPQVPAEPNKVIDLMAALEASVAEAKAARKRHPTTAADDDVESGAPTSKPSKADKAAKATKAAKKKAPAKRSSARKSA